MTKVEATQRLGANIHLHGNSLEDALQFAREKKQTQESVFIHPFDDPLIIAGQGTIGLEMMEHCNELDAIVCSIGGGGLISGVALAAKKINPTIKIYGVRSKSDQKLADGIAVKKHGILTARMIHDLVDEIVEVDDRQVSQAIYILLERCKYLVEGAGAAALAALLQKHFNYNHKKVGVILSGGNIDLQIVSKLIEQVWMNNQIAYNM